VHISFIACFTRLQLRLLALRSTGSKAFLLIVFLGAFGASASYGYSCTLPSCGLSGKKDLMLHLTVFTGLMTSYYSRFGLV
jgi:hypothetical protein